MATPSETVLRMCMAAREPAMLVGAPGTTKTATIKAIAAEMGYLLITIVASRMDAQDLSGFPTKGTFELTEPGGKTKEVPATEYAPQYWQHQIMEHKRVILFLDEFSNAHPSVQASLLSFIQDRQFPNGDLFPEETILVGAMNPTDSAADAYELSKATTNRITFIDWRPDNQKWLDGMLDDFGKGVENEDERKWRSLIVRFLNDEPRFIHHENDEETNTGEAYGVNMSDSSKRTVVQSAWASRRSWDRLARILAFSNGSTEAEDAAMMGTIGASAAQGFRAWLMKHGALNIAGIIKNPRKFKDWKNLSLDDMNIILVSACDSANSENIHNVFEIFKIVAEVDRRSDASPYLKRLSGLPHSIEGVSQQERAMIKREAIETLREYKSISDASHSIRRRAPQQS